MQKVIFGIFAHPDDEAFGPLGTLLVEKAAGSELHLICATAGENGMNPDNETDLGAVRLREWQAAGELIGADSMHHLGYLDGTLNNNAYFDISDKITAAVSKALEDKDEVKIEFITLDQNGLTGHLDHIAIARVASYVFYTLRATDSRFSRIRYACLSRDDHPEENCDWLYMDAGRTDEEINEIVDASAHLEKILAIMDTHRSQRADRDSLLAARGDNIAINHFLVRD